MKTVIMAPDDYKKSGNPITASKYRYYQFRTLLRSGYFAVNSQHEYILLERKDFDLVKFFVLAFNMKNREEDKNSIKTAYQEFTVCGE